MINMLEVLNTYDDTWAITFYFVAAIAIMIGLLWTVYQIHKQEKKNGKIQENVIYNKTDDLIESMDVLPERKRKKTNESTNYYDPYQVENKKQNKVNENKFNDYESKNISENISDFSFEKNNKQEESMKNNNINNKKTKGKNNNKNYKKNNNKNKNYYHNNKKGKKKG